MGCCDEPIEPCQDQNLGCLQQIDAECVFSDNTNILEALNLTIQSNLEEILIETLNYVDNQINNYEYTPTGLGGDCIAGGNPFNFDTWLQNLEAYVCTLESPLTFDNGLERTASNIQWGGLLTKNTTINGTGSFNVEFDILNNFIVDDAQYVELNAGVQANLTLQRTGSPLVFLYSAEDLSIVADGGGIATIDGAQVLVTTTASTIELNSANDVRVNPASGADILLQSTAVKLATASVGQVWKLTDATTGAGEWATETPAPSVFVAQNGLTQPVAGTIEWGGTLAQNTTIDGGSTHDVTFTAPADFIIELATNINFNTVGTNAGINILSGGGGTVEIIAQGSNGNANDVLVSDGTHATWQPVPINFTADNGLTLTGTNVQLGGDLVQNTAIGGQTFNFDLTNVNALVLNSNNSTFIGSNGTFQLDADTTLQINIAGNPGNVNQVLTSDGTNATWQDITEDNNTLDEAYDEGGAGAGRTITADSGAVRIQGTDGFEVLGTQGSGTAIPNRVTQTAWTFFDPLTASFRAGRANGTEWDSTNRGEYSVALGYNGIASAPRSTVIGGTDGSVTTAGSNTVVIGGNGVSATGGNTSLIGTGLDLVMASGTYAVVLGGERNSYNNGNSSVLLGGHDHNLNGGRSAIIGGDTNTLNATDSTITASTSSDISDGDRNFVAGSSTVSIADGVQNVVLGATSTNILTSGVFGSNIVLGGSQHDINDQTIANAIVAGNNAFVNTAVQYAVTLGGDSNGVYGNQSVVQGQANSAKSFSEVSIGTWGTDYTATNATAFSSGDRAFNVGNGSSGGSRSDAFTILKNGQIGIGYNNFEASTTGEILQVNGSVKIADGTEGVGLVFTSDANGVGSWQPISTASIEFATSGAGNNAITAPTSSSVVEKIVSKTTITGGGDTETLPAGAGMGDGQKITVKDASNGAGTDNITVQRNGADTVDGATNAVINTDGGAITFTWDATNTNWIITASVS